MMTTPTANLDTKALFMGLLKQALIWGPIVVGIVHQFLMYLFDIERIYVFVDPPGYISPWASLEYQWWLVLVLISGFIAILAYIDRFPSIPFRIAAPFYIYILFLLILVKPV